VRVQVGLKDGGTASRLVPQSGASTNSSSHYPSTDTSRPVKFANTNTVNGLGHAVNQS
jgi:hypothetical protein